MPLILSAGHCPDLHSVDGKMYINESEAAHLALNLKQSQHRSSLTLNLS
jgi:hypothetical protein